MVCCASLTTAYATTKKREGGNSGIGMGSLTKVILLPGWKDDSALEKEKLAVAQPLPSSTAREVSVKPWDRVGGEV